MKKTILTLLVSSVLSFNHILKAQESPSAPKENLQKPEQPEKPEKMEYPEGKEAQEIIIRSTGDTNFSLKVEISGDKVLINGKPLVDFKEGGITINKRKMIFSDAFDNMNFNFNGIEGLKELENLKFKLNNGQFKIVEKDLLNSQKAFQKFQHTLAYKTFLGVTTEKSAAGAKIVDILKGSAAEKAGLQKEDIITSVNKQIVTDPDELATIIAKKKPTDQIVIYFKRNGKKKDTKAILGSSATSDLNFISPPPMWRSFKLPQTNNDNIIGDNEEGDNEDNFAGDFLRPKRLGLKIQDTEEGGNVKIIEVADSSAAKTAGLLKGDFITTIDGKKINNTDEAREQLHQAEEKSVYQLKIIRSGTEKNIEIKFPKKLKTANL